ncbi:LLM class flavin-dependent oxidoreductase [Aureimonas fodinaquatilis]|uniref:LLM class flavin-dependent oxidoreductase n=1 Tax=Aureimonas fodinaquatilis TaxID=2565783 RepID=A0A5B0DVC4_9HYPH|nr:LLM class flavin-dependent oxidoreductase [Aureimonas fodinaquatilis]KAA0969560.1 LLM class flavin-dependent oxidoreductase [Aureimonas fodinaquatilis]
MKLGFFTMPIHPLDRDWSETLREDQEAFLLADELGFAEAYVGEHVTDQAENITSCMLFLATLAGRVKQMRLGTGTVNLPNTHPAAVAGQIAMLDHLLEGRLNFGISPGGLLSDSEIFGVLDNDRNAMFLESINMVLDIWSKEAPYNLKGQFWNVTTERTILPDIGQGIVGKPLQQPHPPIVVTAVAPFSKGVTAAAARGWDPISANFLMPRWVATHKDAYAEGCKQGGRPVDFSNWRVAKSIFVADDAETARSYARDPGSPYVFYYNQLLTKLVKNGRSNLFKEDQSMPDEAVTLDYVLDRLVIHGTPEMVADQLLSFRETVGPFGTLLYAGHDWKDPALAKKSMRLLAEKVLPMVNSATGERQEEAAQ